MTEAGFYSRGASAAAPGPSPMIEGTLGRRNRPAAMQATPRAPIFDDQRRRAIITASHRSVTTCFPETRPVGRRQEAERRGGAHRRLG